MAWLILVVAGLCEIGWAIGLKYTEGFTRLWPSVATAASMLVSLGLLGLAMKTLPVGTAYAIWVGIGAVAALAFLILVHKLEYFLNARIVGTQIRARAWELLIAMLIMESAFGIVGLIAAPIYYAFLKRELAAANLI